ncbi:MAG: tetratricopeptide repeat protein [Bacteroidaceae bacterium]|nr:tetratricopeptide repeat protein [Bacteroidaceae bacterium]
MKESQSSYFDSNEFLELLNSYESMGQDGVSRYFDGIDISNLAEFYSSTDEDDKALDAIRYGLSVHPSDPDILIAYGHLLLKQGKSSEAGAVADSISETNGRELLFLKGSIELFDEHPDMADVLFSQSVEAGDEDLGLYADIISLYIDYVQYDYAQKWIDRGLSIEPDYKDFLEQQADLFFATMQYDRAADQYNRLLDESPYDIYYWEQLACIAYRQEDWARALDCFEYIEAIDPMYDSMELIRVECLIETDHYADAEARLRKMIGEEPESGEVAFLLGNVLGLQQKSEEAVGYLSQAVEQYPEDPQMHLQLAAAQHDCGRYEDAANSLIRAFRCGSPSHPDNIRHLVLSLLQEDRTELVCDMLNALFDIPDLDMKEYSSFLTPLAMCCWQSGRYEDFRRYFSIAFDNDPAATLRLFGIQDLSTSKETATDILIHVARHQSENNNITATQQN